MPKSQKLTLSASRDIPFNKLVFSQAIAPERPAPVWEEFTALDDEPDDDAQRAKELQDRFCGVARQASLDPEDVIEL